MIFFFISLRAWLGFGLGYRGIRAPAGEAAEAPEEYPGDARQPRHSSRRH
jgi:hypothetical protein